MEKRSESDILAKAPIKIKLGDKVYEVPPLNNLDAREWRIKLHDALVPLVSSFDFGSIDLNASAGTVSNALTGQLGKMLIQFPERIAELLFAFAPNLPQEVILKESSEEQIALAFSQVVEVGYPFFFHLWAARKALATPLPTAGRSPSAQPTRLH